VNIEETKLYQPTFIFTDEKKGRCDKPAQVDPDTHRIKAASLVSTEEIPNNQAETELKYLLNQVGILTGPLTSQGQIPQDCTELKKIIELKGVNENTKISGLLDHLCAGAGWDVKSLKDEIKKLQDIRSNNQDRIPEQLKKPLENKTLYSILDITKSRKDRPQNEESFGKRFYLDMKFENYMNSLHNQLHALQWIENFEKKITSLFKKSIGNNSRYVLHKYLSIARKALMVIRARTQQEGYSDGKSAGVGGEKYWEN
jgi:hypothetical protein